MPELPEVESVRKGLAPGLTGRVIEDVWYDPLPSLPRQFVHPERAVGRRVLSVGRRGKFLIAPLDEGLELIMHLGMTGSLRFDVKDAYARAILSLDDSRTVVYRDPRRFGRVAVVDAGDHSAIPALRTLGPEPLSEDFDLGGFTRALGRSNAPVKALLLAQRAVAGVGNIYADEALWRARIHPQARRVGPSRAARLHAAVIDVIAEAIEREGTTFSDYRMVNGESGRNAPFLAAYGRAGSACPRCGSVMRRTVVAGRGTSHCPRCQR